MYVLKIYYSTGDSFSTEERETIFDDIEWKSLDKAKENLKRVKEHYDWYCYINHTWCNNKIDRPPWHTAKSEDTDSWNLINLITDDDQDYQFWPFWIGYFESLQSVEIISKPDDSMKINF